MRSRVEVVGRIGSAYGAPRLRAATLVRLGSGTATVPLHVRGGLTDAHAWRLVVLSGRIVDTRKLGDRVRAEVAVGAKRVVVVAQPGIGVAAADLPEGATVTVTGIVRVAYPNASDRRPSLLPRSAADVRVTAGPARPAGAGRGTSTASGAGAADGPAADPSSVAAAAATVVPDADLASLAAQVGRTVRVGGSSWT